MAETSNHHGLAHYKARASIKSSCGHYRSMISCRDSIDRVPRKYWYNLRSGTPIHIINLVSRNDEMLHSGRADSRASGRRFDAFQCNYSSFECDSSMAYWFVSALYSVGTAIIDGLWNAGVIESRHDVRHIIYFHRFLRLQWNTAIIFDNSSVISSLRASTRRSVLLLHGRATLSSTVSLPPPYLIISLSASSWSRFHSAFLLCERMRHQGKNIMIVSIVSINR